MSDSKVTDGSSISRWPVITGDALVLKPLGTVDLTALHSVFTDPDVRRYLWDDAIVDIEQVGEILDGNERRMAGGELGLFGVYSQGSDELVGFTGFWEFFEPPVLELLFGLLPAHWGKRWAYEAAQLAIRHAQDVHAVQIIRASTDAPNVRSIALLERLGFVADERRQSETDGATPGTSTRHFVLSG